MNDPTREHETTNDALRQPISRDDNGGPQAPAEGILLIDKERGWTSHDVVAKIRTLLPCGTKVGHAGTLDPLATGLLLILVGSAYTKRSQEFMAHDKVYEAHIRWCATSQTDDAEGPIVDNKDCPCPTRTEIERALSRFRGTVAQVPPVYSAVKVRGTKLYEAARRGKTLERTPRTVTIHHLEITAHDIERMCTALSVYCSSGTYIRALARDLGKTLGCGAYLPTLRRTRINGFDVADTLPVASLTRPVIMRSLVKLTGEKP